MNLTREKHKGPGQQPLLKRDIPDICTRSVFDFMVRRERDRADRGHSIFSIVVFNGVNPADRRLIDTLKHRTRITDSIGWLDASSIGVLLADCPAPGGEAFLADVRSAIQGIQPEPSCRIYTYPDNIMELKDGPLFSTQPVGQDITDTEKMLNNLLACSPSAGRKNLESVVAGLALLMLSPLLLLIVISIKLSSPGPCLFNQMRIGHQGEPFLCYKFRSMHQHADTRVHANHFKNLIVTDTPMKKLDHEDPRIFTVGRILRSSSLDELPQLFNVFIGNMSFIGPRPAIPGEYKDYLPWHRHRIDVLPGLTGLWQVNGKNKTTFSQMIRYDTFYSRHQSPKMDMGIVLKTPAVIINQFLDDHHLRHHLMGRIHGVKPTGSAMNPAPGPEEVVVPSDSG